MSLGLIGRRAGHLRAKKSGKEIRVVLDGRLT